MPLIFLPAITRLMLRLAPNNLFVFGDNLARRGFGGQAREMRCELNAIGLPTKLTPDRYLTNKHLERIELEIADDLKRLRFQLSLGYDVIWPSANIGTGRAKLHEKAPMVEQFYANILVNLQWIAKEAEGKFPPTRT